MAYVIPSDIQTGFVPSIRFAIEPMGPEEELEEFHNPKAIALERKRIVGLLRGGEFSDEHAQLVWDAIIFGVGGVFSAGAFVVIGTTAQLAKIAAKNPWIAKPIGGYLRKVFEPIAGRAARRIGLRKGGGLLDDLAKKPIVKNNPVTKSVVRSGAMGMKAMSMANRLEILDRMDLDLDIDLQELDRFLEREQDFRSRGPATGEDDMPYNRRTGQWYPARRRGGYSRGGGGYSRGGYSSRGRSSSYAPRRRRSYRRW